MLEYSPDQSVDERADEEERDRGEGVGEKVGSSAVKSVGSFPHKHGAFLQEGRNTRDRHEAEEGDGEEAG